MFLLLVILALTLLLLLISRARSRALPFSPSDRVLLVIAHPDDESLFFSPTMLNLASIHVPTYVLCLSNGNAEGKGAVRSKELVEACSVLGIPPSQVAIIDHPLLQDGMESTWDISYAAGHISEAVDRWQVSAILTFDARGVSGHPNHMATFRGVLRSQFATPSEKKVRIFCLESVNMVRKFQGLLDLPLASLLVSLGDKALNVSPSPMLGWAAMMRHRSQMVWYRYLFLLFSTYTVFNVLVPLTSSPEQSFDGK